MDLGDILVMPVTGTRVRAWAVSYTHLTLKWVINVLSVKNKLEKWILVSSY